MKTFKASNKVRVGTNESLNVYFPEGHSLFAKDNVKVGQLVILGTDLEQTLPDGEDVQIRLRMDESRLLTARVYLPLTDSEFKVELTSEISSASVEDLRDSVDEVRETIGQIKGTSPEVYENSGRVTEASLERVRVDLSRIDP